MKTLVDALIQVESQGDDNAIGDKGLTHKAYGCLQIRQPYCDDVNRVYGSTLKAEDMLGNRELSIDTFNKYMSIYATLRHLGHVPNNQDRARLHNGGPAGPWESSTLRYWQKVQKAMNSA